MRYRGKQTSEETRNETSDEQRLRATNQQKNFTLLGLCNDDVRRTSCIILFVSVLYDYIYSIILHLGD